MVITAAPKSMLWAFFRYESDAYTLAVIRIIFFTSMLFCIWYLDTWLQYSTEAGLVPVAPKGYSRFFHLIPFTAKWITAIWTVAVLSCMGAIIGMYARTSATIATLCSAYILGLPNFFGKIVHYHHHLILFGLLLAVSYCADQLSVDAFRHRAKKSEPNGVIPATSIQYGITLRLAWLLFGVLYFFPGLYKILAGWEWFTPESLTAYLQIEWENRHFVPVFVIDQHPWLLTTGAVMTAAIEVSLIAGIQFRKTRPVFAALIAGLHFGIAQLMGIVFISLPVCVAAFLLPWHDIGRWFNKTTKIITPYLQNKQETPDARPIWPIVTVGLLLITISFSFGVLRVRSWPFSVYPRFTYLQTP